jgi:hypothetical protein
MCFELEADRQTYVATSKPTYAKVLSVNSKNQELQTEASAVAKRADRIGLNVNRIFKNSVLLA